MGNSRTPGAGDNESGNSDYLVRVIQVYGEDHDADKNLQEFEAMCNIIGIS